MTWRSIHDICTKKNEIVNQKCIHAFLYKMSNANLRPDELTKAHLMEFGEFAGKVASYCIGKRGAIDSMPKLSEI